MEVLLDFVIPQYRDFKVGRYLYSHASRVFPDDTVTTLWNHPGSTRHRRYLEKMGYRETSGGRWAFDLAAPG